MSKRSAFFLSLFLFTLVDVFLVHDTAWLLRHGTGVRFYINLIFSLLFLGSWLWFARATVFSVRTPLSVRRAGWVLVIVLTCIPALVQLGHFKVYNDVIRPNGFDFAVKNTMETASYFVDLSSFPRMSLAALGWALALWTFARSVPDTLQPRRLKNTFTTSLSFVMVALLIPFGAYNWYSVSLYQNSVYAFYGTLLETVSIRFGAYTIDKPHVPASTVPADDLPNILWVVGESAVKSRMQIYDYNRPTTPRLLEHYEKGDLLRFTNMLAVGNKTMLSLPYMLFGLEGPDPKGRIYRRPSIFNYAKARGMQTGFVSAQDIRWYRFDKLIVDKSLDVVRSGPEYSANVTVRNGADDLKVVNEGLVPFIKDAKKPFLLMYQMNGNHYPYGEHSPKEFKKFLPEPHPNSRNAYDNSMLYTDTALDLLIDAVRREKPNTWIFFVSDHGQALALDDDDTRFHSGYADDVILVPFFVMPPPGTPAKTLRTLRANENGPASQADIFATIMDIIGMEPIRQIDGLSIRAPLPEDRIRFCSEFMPTFSNNPNAAYMDAKKGMVRLDFTRMQVYDRDDNLLSHINELDERVLKILEQRL